ncbi:MAG TPA: hypothetical protein VFY99_10425, partial [Solirubrobacterales bacterium]
MIHGNFLLLGVGVLAMIPIVPRVDTSWYLVIPLMLCGAGLGLLVSQLNNYAGADLRGEGRRGRRRQFVDLVVRPLGG